MSECFFIHFLFLSILETPTISESKLESADIIFLLDESDYMKASERHILDFITEFVKLVEIGPDKVQVALTLYSNKPTTGFLLNTYSQKADVLRHLSNVKLKGGFTLNTGVALDYVLNSMFTAVSGSRAQLGVPQILILLCGKKSKDDVSGAAERLRNARIMLYSVGVNDADRLEMQQLVHSPGAEHFINEISDFTLVREHLLSDIASHKGTVSLGVGE